MSAAPLLNIHTDGASRGNPGAAAFAYVIRRDGEAPIEEAGCLGQMTNNQAEYTALVRALEHALQLGPHHRLLIHSDSELMVKQMKGEYRIKDPGLRSLYQEAARLWGGFDERPRIVHVRREQNSRADELCNLALDGKISTVRRQPPPPAAAPAGRATPRERGVACLRAAAAAGAAGTPPPPRPRSGPPPP